MSEWRRSQRAGENWLATDRQNADTESIGSRMGIPGQGEQDSGVIVKTIPG
jgi:hypothetical protein